MLANAEAQQNERNSGAAKPAASHANKGTVLEVNESPMHTLLQVSCDTGAVWLAARKNIAQIAKGDTTKYSNGVVMRNFYSKSSNRSASKIIFVGSVVPGTK